MKLIQLHSVAIGVFAILACGALLIATARNAHSDVPTPKTTAWCVSPERELLEAIYDPQGNLRRIIPVRAVTELSACTSRGPGSKSGAALKAIQGGGYKVQRIKKERIFQQDIVDGMFAECIVSTEPCEIDVFFGPTAELVKYEKAKTGGLPFSFLLGHAGDAGHYEITRQAMSDSQVALGVTWPAAVIDLIANAAGDADFYDWGTPAAHAQTRNNDDSGKIDQTQEEARHNFQSWVDFYARKALASCRSSDERSASDAAYYLGYMLHALQDLAFHDGITNAQHSYYDNVLKTPVDSNDAAGYPQKMSQAAMGSMRVVVGFSRVVRTEGASCWSTLVKGNISAPSHARKLELLDKKDRGMDFDLIEAIKFRGLGGKVEAGIKGAGEGAYLVYASWLGSPKDAQMQKTADEIVARNFK